MCKKSIIFNTQFTPETAQTPSAMSHMDKYLANISLTQTGIRSSLARKGVDTNDSVTGQSSGRNMEPTT